MSSSSLDSYSGYLIYAQSKPRGETGLNIGASSVRQLGTEVNHIFRLSGFNQRHPPFLTHMTMTANTFEDNTARIGQIQLWLSDKHLKMAQPASTVKPK